MIPLLLIALGGGALAATVARGHRHPSLLDRLTSPVQPPKAQASAKEAPDRNTPGAPADAPGPIRAYLARLDARYQSLVQTHLDPWLAGQLRDQQMLELTKGVQRELNPREKRNNRGLALGTGGLTLIGLARLTGWPFIPAVIAIGVGSVPLRGVKPEARMP